MRRDGVLNTNYNKNYQETPVQTVYHRETEQLIEMPAFINRKKKSALTPQSLEQAKSAQLCRIEKDKYIKQRRKIMASAQVCKINCLNHGQSEHNIRGKLVLYTIVVRLKVDTEIQD